MSARKGSEPARLVGILHAQTIASKAKPATTSPTASTPLWGYPSGTFYFSVTTCFSHLISSRQIKALDNPAVGCVWFRFVSFARRPACRVRESLPFHARFLVPAKPGGPTVTLHMAVARCHSLSTGGNRMEMPVTRNNVPMGLQRHAIATATGEPSFRNDLFPYLDLRSDLDVAVVCFCYAFS